MVMIEVVAALIVHVPFSCVASQGEVGPLIPETTICSPTAVALTVVVAVNRQVDDVKQSTEVMDETSA